MSPVKILLLFMAATTIIILVQAPPMLNQPPIQGTAIPSFYRLVLQWPNSFCRNHTGVCCRQPVPQEFGIHGLWAYDQYGNMIICREGPDLEESDVDGIVELHENWPSHVQGRSNFKFWRKQWWKHGRCIGLTPREYFQKAVDLKKQIDVQIGGSLFQFFRARGLPPDEKKRYDPQSFLWEIKSKTRYVTEIHCNMNKAGDYQLYEIKFCFSNNWQLSNCGIHIQPAYSSNKQGAKTYQKKKGPNSQKISPPPPPPPSSPPTFDIGNCYGNDRILFPALVPASPPPPARRRRSPPPPPKSPPLKRKQLPPPPPPPPPTPTLLKAPPTPPLSPDIVTTYAHILARGTHLEPPPPPSKSPPLKRKQRPPPPLQPPTPTLSKAPTTPPLSPNKVITYAEIVVRGTHLQPPPPPPKSTQPKQKQWTSPPPPPPPTPTHPKAPTPPHLPSYTAITWAQILVRGTYLQPSPAVSAPPPHAKRGRGWKHFMRMILTLINFLIQFGILGALRKLRGGRKSHRKRNVRWMTFIYFFHFFGHFKAKKL